MNIKEDLGTTATYKPIGGYSFIYPLFGFEGEAGEVTEKIKKVFRDKNGVFSEEDNVAILKELGDTLWYLTQLSREFGSSLKEVAKLNIEKLEGRRERGTLHGSGDDR